MEVFSLFKDKKEEAEGKNRGFMKHIIDFITNIRLRGMSRKRHFRTYIRMTDGGISGMKMPLLTSIPVPDLMLLSW